MELGFDRGMPSRSTHGLQFAVAAAGLVPVGAGLAGVLLGPGMAQGAFAGLADAEVLEAAVFGPCRAPVRDTIIGGRALVRDGRHPHGEAILQAYRSALARILR